MPKLKNAILVVFSVLLTFFSIEIYFRAFSPQIMEHDKMFTYDSVLGWRFIPNIKASIFYRGEVSNYIKINTHGFRDTPFPSPNDKITKIIVMGDSFVSNIGVDDKNVFTEILEKQLPNTTVMNFGVNGYSTVQEYLLLNKLLQDYSPDLLILVIYIRNDFVENLGFKWNGIERPKAILSNDGLDVKITPVPTYQPKPNLPQNPIRQLLKKSHLCYFANYHLEWILNRFSNPDRLKLRPTKFTPPELYLCKRTPSKKTIYMYKTMDVMLSKFARTCHSRNVNLLFVIAPSIVQIDSELWSNILAKYKLKHDDFDLTLPNTQLLASAENYHVPVSDLLPKLETARLRDDKLYNLKEQHWTKEGNIVVASEILNYIKSRKELRHIFFQ
jgi:hypothetical protein